MQQKLSELKLPLILVFEILICLFWGDKIPVDVKSAFYAISLTLKGILLMVLPFIIFSFLTRSLSELQKGAFSFAILAFILVVVSNFVSTSLAGFLGFLSLDTVQPITPVEGGALQLTPLWNSAFPTIISNDMALLLAMGVGLMLSFSPFEKPKQIIGQLHTASLLFLKKGFIPLVPLFILGFILKIQHEGILSTILKDYLSIVGMITLFAYGYIVFLYGVATNFQIKKWVGSLKAMLPSMITGFSTMSSASALPLVTQAAVQNTQDPKVAGVVPLTINIHLVGDCFALSILALAIMVSFGLPLPSVQEFVLFTCFFVMAKFAVAAVPGGGVLVMLPILEKYLGFSGEMLSLISALYILFDPIITSANVTGNGAFAMLFSRLYARISNAQEDRIPAPSS